MSQIRQIVRLRGKCHTHTTHNEQATKASQARVVLAPASRDSQSHNVNPSYVVRHSTSLFWTRHDLLLMEPSFATMPGVSGQVQVQVGAIDRSIDQGNDGSSLTHGVNSIN